jgi:Zn ribbon nucleic-acid-binding protein
MTTSVRNSESDEFVVGAGGNCPKCLAPTHLVYHRKDNVITGTCKLCGRIYDNKFTMFENECSCGCGHLALSVIVGDTWHNVMSTCKCANGKYKMHTIRKKVIQ